MLLGSGGHAPRIRWHGDKSERKNLSHIGNTPLVEINYIGCAAIFAKAEYLNPTGSHKDRAYLHMIRAMEAEGQISPGDTLVDYTTGNAGASLAFIAREMGYSAVVTMPEDMTRERKEQIVSYGAELVLTKAEDFVKGARLKAEEIVRSKRRHILINQSENKHNIEAFRIMGLEILSVVGEKTINVFVGAIGTGAATS